MTHILDILAVLFYTISAIYFGFGFFLKKGNTQKIGTLFLQLGFLTHAVDLIVRITEQRQFPASNFIEAFWALTCLTVLIFLIVFRKRNKEAGAIVLLPITIVSVILKMSHAVQTETIGPGVGAGWIYVHIPLMILSVAALTISFLTAIMYLLQERQLKHKEPSFFLERLPSLEAADAISYKSLWLGFFLLTLGILTGMIWSKYLRGVYWSWDSKEIWAAITWGLYAILLHGRMLSAWRGRKAAYLAILGFALILFTFAGVSLVSKVYHSF
jgi:cytochrome c-type biogenesis protein CcsB